MSPQFGHENAPQRSHEEIAELLGVYALHALEPDEAELVEAHVETCATCREELAQHYDMAASMADAALLDDLLAGDGFAGERALPDELTARIWADVRGTRAVVDEPHAPSASKAPAGDLAPVSDLAAARVAREERRGLSRRGRVGAVAAAVALIGASAAPSLLRSTPAPSIAALAARAEKQAGTRVATLRDAKGRAVGTVLVTASGAGYVRNNGLAALSADRTYQLWAVTKQAGASSTAVPISAGVLGTSPTVVAFTTAAPADTYAAYAVSIEPVAGSTSPSSAPVASGALV